MKINLSGKIAIVTGSTAGIGYAIAKGLAQAGAEVVVNGRTAAAVEQAVAKLASEVVQAGVHGAVADVAPRPAVRPWRLHSLRPTSWSATSASYGLQDFFETRDAEWTRFFEVNVMSGVRLARAYLPGMMERRWGRGGVPILGVGLEYSSRHDPLRLYQDRRSFDLARTCQACSRHGRDRQCRPSRPNPLGWPESHAEGGAEGIRPVDGGDGRSLCDETCAAARSSNVRQRWRKWPTWSSMPFAAGVGHHRRSAPGGWRGGLRRSLEAGHVVSLRFRQQVMRMTR